MENRKAPTWAYVISTIISIILCVLLIALMTFLSVRMLASETGLRKLFNDRTAAETSDVINDMKNDCAVLIGVSPDKLDDKEITDLVVDICRDVIRYLETGNGQPLNSDKVIAFINDKKEQFGTVNFTTEFHDAYFEEYYDALINNMNSLNQEIVEEYNADDSNFFNMVKVFMSANAIKVPVYIAIALIILIFLIFNTHIEASLKTVGSTVVATGLFLGFIGWLEWVLFHDNDDRFVIVISKIVIGNEITYAVIFVVAGIILKRIAKLLIRTGDDTDSNQQSRYSGISSDFYN